MVATTTGELQAVNIINTKQRSKKDFSLKLSDRMFFSGGIYNSYN